MKLSTITSSVLIALASVFASVAVAQSTGTPQSTTQTRPADYDFRYVSNGSPALTPSQVFDDGQYTYLQLPPLSVTPAIFAAGTNGRKLLIPEVTNQFLRVPGVYSHLIIQQGQGLMAEVHYSGPGRVAVFKNISDFSNRAYAETRIAEATKTRYTTAVPMAGDEAVPVSTRTETTQVGFSKDKIKLDAKSQTKVRMFAKKVSQASEIMIDASDMDMEDEGTGTKRALAIKSILLANGISESIISYRSTPHPSGKSAPASIQAKFNTIKVASTLDSLSNQSSMRVSSTTQEPARNAKYDTKQEAQLLAQAPVVKVTSDAAPLNYAPPPVAGFPDQPTPQIKDFAKPDKTYDFRLADKTLRGTLNRWAKDEGWDLSWEAERDIPLPPESSFQAKTLVDAMLEVMQGLAESDYPLRVSMVEKNRVIRVLHNDRAR